MFDYLGVLQSILSASGGIFKLRKQYLALENTKTYLINKFNLKIETRITWTGDMPFRDEIYPPEWEDSLVKLCKEIIQYEDVNLELCEVCADAYFFIFVLPPSQIKRKDISDTPTAESLLDLSRGKGNSVSLKLVHRELKQWLDYK